MLPPHHVAGSDWVGIRRRVPTALSPTTYKKAMTGVTNLIFASFFTQKVELHRRRRNPW
jgi:hypothetical protein